MYGYFSRFPWLVLATYFCMTLLVVAELMGPIYLGAFVDIITNPSPDQPLFEQTLPVITLLIVQSLLFHASQKTAHFINCVTDSRVEKLVADEAFNKVQHFSVDWHQNTFAGSNVTKIKRAMAASHTLFDRVCYDLYPLTAITLSMVVLIWLKVWWLGLILAIFSLLFTTLSIMIATRWVGPQNRLANQAENKLGGALADSLSSHESVRSFGAENREIKRFKKVSEYWMLAARWSWIRGNIMGLGQALILNALKLAILLSTAYLWSVGTFTPGEAVFVFTGYNLMSGYLRNIGSTVQEMFRAANDMEDAIIFHKTPLQITDSVRAKPLKVTQGEIELKNITFQYEGDHKPIFKDFSLTIPAGKSVALVGHSGSGKSTLIKLIQRFHDIDEGQIFIDGTDISTATQQSLRSQIALVPQDTALFHRSLAENIAYAQPKASQAAIIKAAKQAHAHEFITRLPQGYETLVGERGVKLSGGERQRVAIARAILADCSILVLDEATSSLDSTSEGYIQDALKALMKKRTSLVVAHRLSTIKEADEILVFAQGQIIERGTHQSLLQNPDGHYTQFFNKQAGGFIE